MENNINEQTVSNSNVSETEELTMEYVLSRLDMIIKSTEHIKNAIEKIGNMEVNESPAGGKSDKARSKAISHTIRARETTNQQLIKLLGKMYEDLKPDKTLSPKEEKKAELISQILNPEEAYKGQKQTLLDEIRHMI